MRPDLARELAPNAGEDKNSDRGAAHIPIELPAFANKLWDLGFGQNRIAVDQVQMQTDTKLGQTMGAGHRIGRCRTTDHQTRGRQNPVAMCLFDGLVDGQI